MADEPAVIALSHVEEHEDGSATYRIMMDDRSQKKIMNEGIRLVIACAASGVDLADVYDWIEQQGGFKDAV